ncbi:DUF3987 domain-containing protein [Vineibacter terrae]|uniref:DUF3987 domain-containing protein n=1 Tax=Vineibacter terrae TaxID=2586908 RepID=UPI002E36838D|nr:DUF3987 domain-containing protein [Vineibacter terrae]HEX2890338.1 DUF3987 domain-containing protein [Vineibacter terrae]
MSAHDFADLTHATHGQPVRWWRYSETFATAAFRDRTGRGIVVPAVRDGGRCCWREPAAPLPLFGAAALATRPEAPVLVVQNEAAAAAAQALFPDHVCVAWPGGCNAVDKADIAPLRGRDVILWADDDAGGTAMARFHVRLRGEARSITRIGVPRSWPAPWDGSAPPPLPPTAIDALRRLLRREARPRAAAGRSGGSLAATAAATVPPADTAQAASPPRVAAGPQGSSGRPVLSLPRVRRDAARFAPPPDEARDVPAPRAAAATDASGWPLPPLAALDDGNHDLPTFPLDVLPPSLRPWAENMARAARAPVDHVVLSLLTAAAGLIGASRRITPAPSWSEPCVLWTALVGPSADTARAAEAALGMVRALELVAAVAPGGSDAAPAPARRPLIVNDARMEAVAAALDRSPSGVLLPREGHRGWLNDLVAKGGGDQAFWLSAWSGAPHVVDPRRGPAIALACPAVSILGVLPSDPGAVAPALPAAADALTACLLFAWPSLPPFQPLPAEPGAAVDAACAALARLCDLSLSPGMVPLTPAARAAFEGFRQRHHAGSARLAGREADWWGRGPANVLRLAGVLAFLDDAALAQVPEGAISAASRLWLDYLWPHARAVLRDGGGRPDHAQRVLRWLRRQRCAEVSPEALRREALGQACNAAATERIAAALVADGWLRPVVAPRGKGRPPRRWRVNPHLLAAPDP